MVPKIPPKQSIILNAILPKIPIINTAQSIKYGGIRKLREYFLPPKF